MINLSCGYELVNVAMCSGGETLSRMYKCAGEHHRSVVVISLPVKLNGPIYMCLLCECSASQICELFCLIYVSVIELNPLVDW